MHLSNLPQSIGESTGGAPVPIACALALLADVSAFTNHFAAADLRSSCILQALFE